MLSIGREETKTTVIWRDQRLGIGHWHREHLREVDDASFALEIGKVASL